MPGGARGACPRRAGGVALLHAGWQVSTAASRLFSLGCVFTSTVLCFRFLIGEASSGPSGFVFASGCNAHGVSGSPALGHFVAEAVLRPAAEHSEYLRSLSPDRFEATAAAGQGDAGWGLARKQAQQIYEDCECRNGLLSAASV